MLAAVAFRVGNVAAAFRRVLELGAWAVHTEVEVMELNIPAIHGVGASRIYFVDRWNEFSIYDVDFVPIPTVTPRPPALQGLHLFGVDGKVLAGPPPRPLDQFQSKIENGQIMILLEA